MTGVKRELIIQIAREFAQNAVDTNGRSMIIVGRVLTIGLTLIRFIAPF